MTDLQTYIKKHGAEVCAARWGYKLRRVQSYLYRQRIPSHKAAMRIVSLTGGEVTLAGMFAPLADAA